MAELGLKTWSINKKSRLFPLGSMVSPFRGEPGPGSGGLKGTVQKYGFDPFRGRSHLHHLESEDDLMTLACENINPAVINGLYWRMKELLEGQLGEGDNCRH